MSFVAGWAILLDYVILLAVAAFTATNYLGGAFWARSGTAGPRSRSRWRSSRSRSRRQRARPRRRAAAARVAIVAVVDLVLQAGLIVLGLVLVLQPRRVARPDRTWAPRRPGPTHVRADAGDGRVHRPGVGLGPGRRGGGRPARAAAGWCCASSLVSIVLYVGIALVAITRAAGGRAGETLAGPQLPRGPAHRRGRQLRPARGWRTCCDYLVGGGAVTLVAAAQLGDARALAARLLARHEPPDPERARPPAPDALDARMC